MQKLVVRYRFTRANNSAAGFARANRASTDALNALWQWQAGAAGREFTRLADEDDHLDVEVKCNADDADAGIQLEAASEKVGVERQVIA
jgi:hypothetical protein